MMEWKNDSEVARYRGFIMGKSGRIEIEHYTTHHSPNFNVTIHSPYGFTLSRYFTTTLDEAKAWGVAVLEWMQSHDGKAWADKMQRMASPSYQRLKAAIAHAKGILAQLKVEFGPFGRRWLNGRIEEAECYLGADDVEEEQNILAAELEAFTPPPCTLPEP